MGLETSCKDLAKELEQRKAAIQEYVRRAEGLPSGEWQSLDGFADEVKAMAKDINAEINHLRRECPTDWQTKKRQLEFRFSLLKKKMDEALSRLPSEIFIG